MPAIVIASVGGADKKLEVAIAENAVANLYGKPLSDMKLLEIAKVVRDNWEKVNYAAEPYLQAMFELSNVSDAYFQDSGRSVVAYFLANAQSFKGAVAKAVKAELNRRIK